MLTAALQSIANPALPGAVTRDDPESGRRLPTSEALGEAFSRFVERFPVGTLPTGGSNATVMVTIPLETLEGRLRSASIGALGLSPAEARRLACAAGVVPAVLGTDSTVLDLGRRSRLYTLKQRQAMPLQQGGLCAVSGCGRPASWGDAHHLVPWSRGGRTDVGDGVLICPRHHTFAHDERFDVVRLGVGRIRFNRRT